MIVVRDTSNDEMIYDAAKLVRLLSRSVTDYRFKKNSTYRPITSEDVTWGDAVVEAMHY